MPISDPAFASSVAFDMIEEGLRDPAQKKDAMAKGKAIFTFTLKNTAGKTESWYIDLKKTGTVGKGLAPAGDKPTGMPYATNVCKSPSH